MQAPYWQAALGHNDWPVLPTDLADEACKAVLETGKAKIHAAFKIEDTSAFLKLAFTKSIMDRWTLASTDHI